MRAEKVPVVVITGATVPTVIESARQGCPFREGVRAGRWRGFECRAAGHGDMRDMISSL